MNPIKKSKLEDVSFVANTLGVSKRHVMRLNDLGKMPRAIKLGRSVRWNRQAIYTWIEAGCPDLSKRRRPKK